MHKMRNLGQDMRRQPTLLSEIIKTMHRRLVSYLRDNRDQILENWLTEIDLPLPPHLPDTRDCQGTIPLSYLQAVFDKVILSLQGKTNQTSNTASSDGLDSIINVTCSCHDKSHRGRVCLELHEAGLRAFHTIFEDAWDADGEFSPLDRECCMSLINQALGKVIQNEIQNCQHKHSRSDCPFV
jgi:hypothetical protein